MNYSCHVPLSMEFPRQEYWSGLPFPSLGDIPNPGTKPMSLALQVDALPLSHPGRPVKSLVDCKDCFKKKKKNSVYHLDIRQKYFTNAVKSATLNNNLAF